MVKRTIGSNFNSSNVHGVVDDNNNPYKNMVMNVMRMNQGYAGKCSIVDEVPNAGVPMSFDLLKKSN
jgi:hypothetical protein